MRPSTPITLIALAATLAAARSTTRHDRFAKRSTVLSAQYATEKEGDDYLLSNNLWGMYSGSGSQTTEATGLSGNKLSWKTTYTWADASSSVKSYANVGLETGLPATLSSIGFIPSSWSWSYTTGGTDLVADVSYDLWLSEDSTCGNAVSCSTWEVMVWLSGRGGCVPAGSYSKTVTVGGKSWKLWTGNVQEWQIASFVAVDEIADYDGDLMDFFDYLTENLSVSSSQYVTTIQAGTEPFTGSATLTTSSYSVSVVAEGAQTSSSAAATSSKTASSSSATSSSKAIVLPSSIVPVSSKSTSPVATSTPSSAKVVSSTPVLVAASSSIKSSSIFTNVGQSSSSTLPVDIFSSAPPTKATKTVTVTVTETVYTPNPTLDSSIAVAASSTAVTSANLAAAYAQCGGTGWTGATTCVSGWTCSVQNPFYSQCVASS